MANNKVRHRWCDLFIVFALIVNAIIMFVGMVFLFFTTDVYGVYAASISAASALFNCIGLTLIMRWHHIGTIFVAAASLLSAIALSITCAGWLTYSFGNIGVYLPYIISFIYIGMLFGLLSKKVQGKSAWQQMDSSMDLAHFRHIYQLSACILFVIFVIAFL